MAVLSQPSIYAARSAQGQSGATASSMAMYGLSARSCLCRALERGVRCGGRAAPRRQRRGAVDDHGQQNCFPDAAVATRWPHVSWPRP